MGFSKSVQVQQGATGQIVINEFFVYLKQEKKTKGLIIIITSLVFGKNEIQCLKFISLIYFYVVYFSECKVNK